VDEQVGSGAAGAPARRSRSGRGTRSASGGSGSAVRSSDASGVREVLHGVDSIGEVRARPRGGAGGAVHLEC
jgi:hypothetical protein